MASVSPISKSDIPSVARLNPTTGGISRVVSDHHSAVNGVTIAQSAVYKWLKALRQLRPEIDVGD
jgi:hypothetical protein